MLIDYKTILDAFPSIQHDCYLCFCEIKKIKIKIDNKSFNSDDLNVLRGVFQRRQDSLLDKEVLKSEVAVGFWDKEKLFFSAHMIRRGNMLSKPEINFFDYASQNEKDYGMLYSFHSLLREQMETAWYGLLQKYGKVVISAAKDVIKPTASSNPRSA
ncbi:MAG: hypothetical protein R2828_10180 [Saprospiraceae bacterium]